MLNIFKGFIATIHRSNWDTKSAFRRLPKKITTILPAIASPCDLANKDTKIVNVIYNICANMLVSNLNNKLASIAVFCVWAISIIKHKISCSISKASVIENSEISLANKIYALVWGFISKNFIVLLENSSVNIDAEKIVSNTFITLKSVLISKNVSFVLYIWIIITTIHMLNIILVDFFFIIL